MALLTTGKTMLAASEVRGYFRTALLEDKLDLATLNALVPVLMAQSALETGHWKSMYGYNFGNVRAGSKWQGDIVQIPGNEVIAGHVVKFSPPVAGEPGYGDPRHMSSFRGFTSALEGARDYIKFVRTKYPEAWAAALRGDAAGFVHALKMRGYFTADEAPYVKAVVSLVGGFRKLDDPMPFYYAPPLPWVDLKRLSGPWSMKDIQRALNAVLPPEMPQLATDGLLGPKTTAALNWAEAHYQTTSIEDTLKAIGIA